MKFMNQHYGRSRIFGKCRFAVSPDTNSNLAEPGINDGEPVGVGTTGSANTEPSANVNSNAAGGEQTVEELMAQVAQLQADLAKQKNSLDKATRERGEAIKQLRSKMTAQEQLEAAKKEAEEANQAELKALRDWKQISEFVEECMDKDIGMEKATAKEFSEALVNGDSSKAFKALGNHIKALRAEWEKEIDARSPEVRAGSGNTENNLPVALAEKLAKKNQPTNSNGLDKWISGGRR